MSGFHEIPGVALALLLATPNAWSQSVEYVKSR